MIRVDVEQGSSEWKETRRGIPTASQFSRIVTPTGKLSAQSHAYLCELLAESFCEEWEPEYVTAAMARGWELEEEAVQWYELTTGETVDRVGFCFRDESRLVGCSPDGLIGEHGGLEIKCRGAGKHVDFLLSGEVPGEYGPQIQGNLWVTGRKWWDYLSYHPGLPSRTVRVLPDEEWIENLALAMERFTDALKIGREQIAKKFDLEMVRAE